MKAKTGNSTTPIKVVEVQPPKISPEQVHSSPHGLSISFDILIEPPIKSKMMPVYFSPSSTLTVEDKMKIAQERKKDIDMETVNKQKEKGEKIKNAKRQILESMERQKEEVSEKISKKESTVEEKMAAQKKEFEEKREAKNKRLMEARKIHEVRLEQKRKLAEQKLAQMKLVEEKHEANRKAVIEKAKCDLIKVEMVRAEQQKKIEELDEKINQTLTKAEERRTARLSETKEKWGKHVEKAKRNAELVKMNRVS